MADPQVSSTYQRCLIPWADIPLSMFIGEFMCGIPLLWAYYKNRNATKTRPEGYSRVATDEVENEEEEHPLGHHHDQGQLMSGWRMCLLWFPAFFDSECTIPCDEGIY